MGCCNSQGHCIFDDMWMISSLQPRQELGHIYKTLSIQTDSMDSHTILRNVNMRQTEFDQNLDSIIGIEALLL